MGQQSQLLCDQLGRFVIAVLLVVLGNVRFAQGSGAEIDTYSTDELDALQAIFEAWRDTPELSSNLDGWSTSQAYPCMEPNWRGVQCLKHNRTVDSNNVTNWNINIVGLSISNASIVGTLSPSIANLTWLTTLELTQNPELIGPLPIGLQNLWLNVLDIHDNNFNGAIPNWETPWNLVQFDIAWNQFTGELPDLSSMPKLIHLDVSGNEFVGLLPDLRNFSALQTVNLADNKFSWTGNFQDTFNLSAKVATIDLTGSDLSGILDLIRLEQQVNSNLRMLKLTYNRITDVRYTTYFITMAKPVIEYVI